MMFPTKAGIGEDATR